MRRTRRRMPLDDWLRAHPYLNSLGVVRARIDAAVAAEVKALPVPTDWDDYVEDYAAGVPLLQSQVRIDLAPAGAAIVDVLRNLADGTTLPLSQDAAALSVYLEGEGAGRIVDWLLGDD